MLCWQVKFIHVYAYTRKCFHWKQQIKILGDDLRPGFFSYHPQTHLQLKTTINMFKRLTINMFKRLTINMFKRLTINMFKRLTINMLKRLTINMLKRLTINMFKRLTINMFKMWFYINILTFLLLTSKISLFGIFSLVIVFQISYLLVP